MRPHGPRALLRNKENPELERIPGLCCRPQAALRPRCCPSVPQGPARPPPREELSARSLHISNTPPARHARSHPTTAAVPAPLSSDPPPDLTLGPTPAGPPALPSPEGASERRPGAERRRDCGPGRPPSFSGQGWARDSQIGHPRPLQASPPGRRFQAQRERPTPGKLPRRSPSWGGGGGVRRPKRSPQPSDRPCDGQTADSPSPPEVPQPGVACPAASGPGRRRLPCIRAPEAPVRCSRLRLRLRLPRPLAERGPPGAARAAGGGAARGPGHPGGGRPWPTSSAQLDPAATPSLPSRRRHRHRGRARIPPLGWLRPGGRGRGAEQGACLRGRLRAAPRTAPPPPLGGAAR
uniref:Uncharacterized protein n=1 Tax=Rangifer tarandus platyrhynchus TaxID=3082113 RepID=A0ACB0FNV4_RANTA|nr:unnamed protein product [Rangifer tarandus platyrhynchus]